MEIAVGGRMPELVLRDAEERDVRVADLCSGRPAVLVFLRHFG